MVAREGHRRWARLTSVLVWALFWSWLTYGPGPWGDYAGARTGTLADVTVQVEHDVP